MSYTLDRYLEHVAPALSPQLIAADALQSLRALARHLPTTAMGGFECRTAQAAASLDLAIAVTDATPQLRALFAGEAPASQHFPLLMSPAWRPVRRFCTLWSDRSSPAHDGINTLWLEFDLAQDPAQAEAQPPNVLFGFPGGQANREVVVAALEALWDAPCPAPLLAQLDRCLAALPERAALFQVGTMLARARAGLRLCISQITPDTAPALLRALDWAGPLADAQRLLEQVAPWCSELALSLDVGGAAVAPYLGVECYPASRRRVVLDPQWLRCLDYLVAEGLCLPAKRDALVAWCGASSIDLPWQVILMRGLNHLKLTLYSGRPLEAKLYFGYAHAGGSPASAGSHGVAGSHAPS